MQSIVRPIASPAQASNSSSNGSNNGTPPSSNGTNSLLDERDARNGSAWNSDSSQGISAPSLTPVSCGSPGPSTPSVVKPAMQHRRAGGAEGNNSPFTLCSPVFGVIKSYSAPNGYGFVTTETSPPVEVYVNVLHTRGFGGLKNIGGRVKLTPVQDAGRLQARNVIEVDENGEPLPDDLAYPSTLGTISEELLPPFTLGMPTNGLVKSYHCQEGYGFIVSETNPRTEVFVHHAGIVGDGFRALNVGAPVQFEAFYDGPRLQASNVRQSFKFIPFVNDMNITSVVKPFRLGIQLVGVIKFFERGEGYGGIISVTDPPTDVHVDASELNGHAYLMKNTKVTFTAEASPDGTKYIAKDVVQVLTRHRTVRHQDSNSRYNSAGGPSNANQQRMPRYQNNNNNYNTGNVPHDHTHRQQQQQQQQRHASAGASAQQTPTMLFVGGQHVVGGVSYAGVPKAKAPYSQRRQVANGHN